MNDISNQTIAEVLRQIGEYLAMQQVQFKPRAFEKAAEMVGALEEDISKMYASGGIKKLKEIPGVGQSIAEIIEELIKTGRSTEYEKLKKATPVRLDELARVEGLGRNRSRNYTKSLGVRNLKDLEAAAKKGKIGALEGFGAKSEEKILKGIGFAKSSGSRFITGLMLPQIHEIEAQLAGVAGVTQSDRRRLGAAAARHDRRHRYPGGLVQAGSGDGFFCFQNAGHHDGHRARHHEVVHKNKAGNQH